MNFAAKCVLTTLVCLACISPLTVAQSRHPSADIVIEATSTNWGIGRPREEYLFVRLMDDGSVEWDDWAEGKWTRHSSSLSDKRVSEIERALDQVDTKSLHGRSGPYYVYTDTGVELAILAKIKHQKFTFSVANPWVGIPVSGKSMPGDIRTVVCQVDRLESQVAKTPMDRQCKSSTTASPE